MTATSGWLWLAVIAMTVLAALFKGKGSQKIPL
jgi:hypothetical protein